MSLSLWEEAWAQQWDVCMLYNDYDDDSQVGSNTPTHNFKLQRFQGHSHYARLPDSKPKHSSAGLLPDGRKRYVLLLKWKITAISVSFFIYTYYCSIPRQSSKIICTDHVIKSITRNKWQSPLYLMTISHVIFLFKLTITGDQYAIYYGTSHVVRACLRLDNFKNHLVIEATKVVSLCLYLQLIFYFKHRTYLKIIFSNLFWSL